MAEETKKYEILTLRSDDAGQAGHWQRSANSPYGKDSIDESNSSTTTEPTSIPSPFARMELARTAFDIAAASRNWENVPKRYQKIVSDCLDVAEIFFNYPMYSKYVEIIKWDIENLKKAPLNGTELGIAMDKFIHSDKGTYHFDRLNAIYLLNYIGDNKPNKTGLNIIGATSPITMFFSVDNDLSYVKKYIHFTNGDEPFDGGFNPLEKRDVNFVQYLANTIINYNQTKFAADFKEFHDYIKSACDRTNAINFDQNTNNYNNIEVTQGSGNFVEVLGFYIGSQGVKSPQKSDFEIKSSLVTTGKLPLVLPTEVANSYQNCAYIDANDLWGNKNYAPIRDDKPIESRILPGTNIKYPYLTNADFFEDTIIKMPYRLNNSSFFNGNVNEEIDDSFLLPLTPTFFKYFTAADVRKMMKMEVSGSVVKITLQVPIQNYSNKAGVSYVTYVKTYQTNQNVKTNTGSTKVVKFSLGITPLVKTSDVNVSDYRIAIFDKVGISKVRFFDKEDELTNIPEKMRREISDICGIKTYVIEKRHFDRIDVCIEENHGYIIPLFEEKEGSKQFRFAVDFGTTNTHIAYSVSNETQSKPFECTKPQIVRLHENYSVDKDIIPAFEDNYLPTGVNDSKMEFPIRSAFAETRSIDYREKTFTLSDGNIPFRYEKVGPVDYLNIQTGENLKWSANKERIKLYIRNIAFILHNKVLLENGKLKDVQIRWFYPSSMSTYVRTMMEQAWNEAYKDYFDANYVESSGKITSMSESIAPYCHYINKDEAMGIVTSIDIGGGTTDVYIAGGKKKADGSNDDGLLMSFRFASDAIFGDGYNSSINNNGFVKKYYPILEDALHDEEGLKDAMSKIKEKGDSAELISFFFSLSSMGKPGLNFMDQLVEDQKFKYVFLVFYTAILYHVAQAMKAKGIDFPQTVAFSGNGSKTLQVISQNREVQKEFVKTVFEKVYGKEYPKNQKFLLKFDNQHPKEATANGGLEAFPEQANAKPEPVVLLGIDNSTFVSSEKYDFVDNKQKQDIVNNVIEFLDFIPSLNINNSFGDKYNLDVTILSKVIEISKQNLDGYLERGIDKVNKLISEDSTQESNVNETLFFFPLVGVLNNLSQEMYDIDCNN